MSNADAWRGKKLQVHGNVVDGSIEQAKGTLLYRFKIESRAPRAARGHHAPPTTAWSPTRSRRAPRWWPRGR